MIEREAALLALGAVLAARPHLAMQPASAKWVWKRCR
jgi:hypothetical protein